MKWSIQGTTCLWIVSIHHGHVLSEVSMSMMTKIEYITPRHKMLAKKSMKGVLGSYGQGMQSFKIPLDIGYMR